jgi:hypothetical protein
MDYRRALTEISDIRMQMCRTRLFRGYTAPTTFSTALMAILAAASQGACLGHVVEEPVRFVQFWMGTAAICVALCGFEVARRYRTTDSFLQRELTLSAIEQLVPCLFIAAAITCVLCAFAPGTIWMLPGLWQIFFGMGLANSRRLLPSAVVLIAVFYISCGLLNLTVGPSVAAFSAWRMGIPFAIGQSALALLLRRGRSDEYAA